MNILLCSGGIVLYWILFLDVDGFHGALIGCLLSAAHILCTYYRGFAGIVQFKSVRTDLGASSTPDTFFLVYVDGHMELFIELL